MANLLQFEKQINPRGNVAGFDEHEEVKSLPIEKVETRDVTLESNVTLESENEVNLMENIPSVSTKVQSSTKIKSAEKERIILLRKQTELQEDQCNQLNSIKGYLKDVSRYKKRGWK